MKRIFSLLLTLCILFSMATPALAAETGAAPITSGAALGISENATPTEAPEVPGDDTPATPEIPAADGELPDVATPSTTSDELCDTIAITPASGFEGEDSEFFTRIRLTITDRDGNPVAGAVYGLYRMTDNTLVEYLTTDRYGVAVSSDVPVNTDYYLLEESAPEGFLPNTERKDIILTEVCAPSRVDVSAVYDPIIGRIQINKVDEEGNPLPGAGFYVYRQNPWGIVETLTTGSDGTAVTGDLPYGQYELYEYSVPEGFSGSGWEYVFISSHDQTEEITVTNYKARGSVRVYKTGNDDRKISGAVFSIYKTEGDQWIEDITTNSSGYAYSSSLLLGNYYAVEKSVPTGYTLDTAKQAFTISYSGQIVYLNITNNRSGESGKVKVVKTDDSANPLSGVVFGLYRTWDNKKLGELTTGSDGTAESGLLIPQDYYLVELTGKTGYAMVTGQIPFTIDGTGVTVTKTVENPKIRIFGKVKVIKKDDAGTPIPGVRFGVYCGQGNLLEELTTGSDGTATSGVLNEGTGYYLLELEGLPGYLPDTNPHLFNITVNNVVVPVNVTNPRITGGVRIIKTGNSGEPLSGVVFGIYKGGVKIGQVTTGVDGTAASGTLYYGADYELRELSTAEGYELIDTPIPFSILEQGVIVEIPVSNPLILGSVTVIKVDEATIPQVELAAAYETGGTPLAGAVFGLYNAQGQKLAELTTGEDGTATYSGLPKSEYFLKELSAPEGFVLTDKIIPFAIETQAHSIEIVVPNAKGFGVVKVVKTGEDGEVLPGVVFDVYRITTDELVAELITGEDGTAALELPLGRYYFVETATAEGFRLLEGRVSFALTTDGAVVELPIQNQREVIPAPEGGKIRLIKKDADSGAPLLGAVFGVYRTDNDERVAELVTGSDGTAVSAALPVLESGYYLLEQAPPTGYMLSTDKIPVSVADSETAEVVVTNKATDTPTPTPEPGKLLIIKKADGTGIKLKDAVFGVYNASTDEKLAELTTDQYGEASVELPAGDFYLRELAAPAGYKLNTDRLAFRIKSNETNEITIINKAVDTPTPAPGKLLIIKKADGSGEKLKGAVFGVYQASDDKKVTEITTDRYGEATFELAEGDYYLRELEAPTGFKLDTDRISFKIKSGQVKEITVTNKAESTTPTPTPESDKLLIIKKADKTGEKLSGAVFGVYQASNDKKVAEITTDRYGEATLELAEGDYYLRELEAPTGYKLTTDRIAFRIKSDQTKEITVTNKADTPVIGTLRLIKKSEDGKLLSGAVFGVYDADTNKKLAELTTDRYGEAELELDAGGFYLRELKAPNKYALVGDKISFKIKVGETKEIVVTNKLITPDDPDAPDTGTLQLIKKAEGTGKRLPGAVFGVYDAATDKKVSEITTDKDGTATLELAVGGYYLKELTAPTGYTLETSKIAFTIKVGATVKVEVTNMLIKDTPAPGDTGTPGITVPKTGEAFPTLQYMLAALCFVIAALCGILLGRERKQRRGTNLRLA